MHLHSAQFSFSLDFFTAARSMCVDGRGLYFRRTRYGGNSVYAKDVLGIRSTNCSESSIMQSSFPRLEFRSFSTMMISVRSVGQLRRKMWMPTYRPISSSCGFVIQMIAGRWMWAHRPVWQGAPSFAATASLSNGLRLVPRCAIGMQ